MPTWRDDAARLAAKAGPFSATEDKIILSAVHEFAAMHDLSTTDWEWLGNLTEVKRSASRSKKEGFMKQARSATLHPLSVVSKV